MIEASELGKTLDKFLLISRFLVRVQEGALTYGDDRWVTLNKHSIVVKRAVGYQRRLLGTGEVGGHTNSWHHGHGDIACRHLPSNLHEAIH